MSYCSKIENTNSSFESNDLKSFSLGRIRKNNRKIISVEEEKVNFSFALQYSNISFLERNII